MSKKIGVLLIQLGTPDSPKNSDVRRYLKEFLMDPRVIDIPFFSRLLLVRGIIVPFRTPKSAKIYKELWDLGKGKSPLLTYTEEVKRLLQRRFESEDVTVEMAMRWGQLNQVRHVIVLVAWLLALKAFSLLAEDSGRP